MSRGRFHGAARVDIIPWTEGCDDREARPRRAAAEF
jgi:hypothetical protein